MKEHDKVLKTISKEYLQPLGLECSRSKKLWVDDNGFFLTYVDISPWHGYGAFFDVAIQFLWNSTAIKQFEYYFGDTTRITSPESEKIGGAILFEELDWQNNLRTTLQLVVKKVYEYRELRDLNILSEHLYHRSDLFAIQFNDFRLRDLNRAVILKLLNNDEEADKIVQYIQQNDSCYENLRICNLLHMRRPDFIQEINKAISEERERSGNQFNILKKSQFDFPVDNL